MSRKKKETVSWEENMTQLEEYWGWVSENLDSGSSSTTF